MDGRLKDISDPFIVKSSEITISHDKVGAGNFADVYKGLYSISFRQRSKNCLYVCCCLLYLKDFHLLVEYMVKHVMYFINYYPEKSDPDLSHK